MSSYLRLSNNQTILMLETEENQIDNKAFTAECHTVLMAGFGYIVCRWRQMEIDDDHCNDQRK